ncbi:hypothetical protein [Bacillus infantis]|uniref:hypothetical protein n=1 Tax=Bacillus infantis TaxID=324767 RepID=UPI003CE977A1
MITLIDIKQDEKDENKINIDFSYEGENMTFNGQLFLTPNEFLASRHKGDDYMLKCILQREIQFLINGL